MRWLLCAAIAVVAGCDSPALVQMRNSLPTPDLMQSLAGSLTTASTPSQSGQSQQGLSAPQAGSYTLTVNVIHGVENIPVAVFTLLQSLAKNEPSSFDGTTARWGPADDDTKGTTWRATISRDDAVGFRYAVDEKPKGTDDSAFLSIISGSHQAFLDDNGNAMKGLGKGNLSVDFDAAHTLPGHDNTVGKTAYTYGRTQVEQPLGLGTTFRSVIFNDQPADARFDLDFTLNLQANGGGGMGVTVQQVAGFVTPAPTTESVVLHSLWGADGAGRADWVQTSHTLTAPSRGTECWDATHISVFEVVSDQPGQDHGSPAACELQAPVAVVAP
jgi:hypothetical protein